MSEEKENQGAVVGCVILFVTVTWILSLAAALSNSLT